MANYQDLADMSPVLKNVYLPVRKDAFQAMTPLLAAARRGSADSVRYAGNDLFFDIIVGKRGGMIASRVGNLPESQNAPERQGRLGISRVYFTVEVDGLNARATEDSKGSFISASKKLVADVMKQWKIEQERILHGDGRAVRAVIIAKTSDTVWTADSPYGISGAGPGNLHLEPGDTCALLDASASFAVLGKGKVLTITRSGDTATITFDTDMDGGGTGAAGDLLVTATPTATSATDTSFGAEPYGIDAITDVAANFATFEGINHARWVAQKLTSASVDETIVMKLLNTIRAKGGVEWRDDPKAMLLVTSTGIWQSYGESLLGLRRFAAPEMTVNGGFTATKVAGAALLDDPWCPRGRLYAIHTPDTLFVDLLDFGLTSLQDAPRWQRSATRDAYQAVFASYWNYGATVRNTHGVISGITDTVDYSPAT